ncbi:hypothetical protein [Sphingobacterium sp. 1.A.4]|uniref:hypothetical protein n=1 Tax=Sphingobacterium sp. 1.A.4 TaxID=2044603 RepID=UPI000C0BCD0E|nr:hypothetical protein [Sphingobacterium sp. 1.A.4]
MKIAVTFGSNKFIGTDGVISYVKDGKLIEFFRIRELFRERSDGSYLVVDCDIKDADGERVIKLAKSKPVASSGDIQVEFDKKHTTVTQQDGSLILKVEQLTLEESKILNVYWIKDYVESNGIEAVINITGIFQIEGNIIYATDERLILNEAIIAGNTCAGTNGLVINGNSISIG